MRISRPGRSQRRKSLIILFLFLAAGTLKPQNTDTEKIYEVEPGTKGNKIILQLSNISQTTGAENVNVNLVKASTQLRFNKKEFIFEKIDKAKDKEAEFLFDISFTAPANIKDTVEFQITSGGINIKKSFILQYSVPEQFELFQNYPNPFNPLTIIRYSISGATAVPVNLKVFDILGREVRTLVNAEQQAGNYEIIFGGERIASGVYIYRLTAGSFVSIKKMILLR